MWGGGNSAAPERLSPAALLVQSRSQQKIFLFLLEEKIGRAQIKKCEENFLAGWRALASGGGANQPFRSKKVRAKCKISPPIFKNNLKFKKNKNMDTQKISWTFPDYQKPDRSRNWYIWTGIFFFGMLAYAIFTANFLFGLIIIMVAIIIFINNNKKTEKVNFTISPDGIEIQGRHYSFKEIKKFWLLYEPPEVKNLYFSFKSSIRPTLSVPLLDQNPLIIRNLLKTYLPEDLEKENESTSEALARVLKL